MATFVFILALVGILPGFLLYRMLALGGWVPWIVFVAFHALLAFWLFTQTSAGQTVSEQISSALMGMLVFFYLIVTAVVALLRAFSLFIDAVRPTPQGTIKEGPSDDVGT